MYVSSVKCPLFQAKSVLLTVHGMKTVMRAVMGKWFLLRDKLAPSSTDSPLI